MPKKIVITQKFNRPVQDVFDLLSKHATYNQAFWPAKIERIKDAVDAESIDGVGSIRKLELGPLMLAREQITLVEQNQLIEYKIINNPLVKHHLGRLCFQPLSADKTLLTYTIEFEAKYSLVSLIVLAQLKVAVTLGIAKLARALK